MPHKNPTENLTELQAAAVEAYRQRLAENLPEVEILDIIATDGIIEVRLNDVVMRDYSTLHCATGLSIEVEDKFNMTLLPHTVPHEN